MVVDTKNIEKPPRGEWGRKLAIGAVIVLLIVVLDRASLIYRGPHGVAAWYPSTGLALYAAFRMGRTAIPWLLAGFLIADLWVWGHPLDLMAVGMPFLKVALILPAAAWMRRGTSGDRLNCEPREIVHFLVVAVCLSLMLALVLNLFFLLVEGTEWAEVAGAHLDEPIRTFLLHRVGAWLAGDLVGILLIFPFVFLLEQIYWRSRMGGALLVPGGERGWRGRVILLAEALVYLLAIVALVRFVLLSPWGWHFNLLFLAFLLVVPVSIRHGFFGAVLVAVAIDITGLAVIGFSEVRFVMQENSAVFHVFQLFVMALIITGMFLGAAFDQIRLARAELLQAKTAAEEASRAKTRFLQNVGHELRTPLNAILGFAQMMRDEVLGPVGVPRYRDYLDDILAAGRHLLGLVDRLLAVAAEDGSEESPELVPLDPAEIARRAVEMITPHAENADARLLLEAPGALPKVLGEEGRLLQVLLNLLDNAIKHGPRGGTVRLIVVAKEEAGEDLREGAPFLQASGRFVRFAVEDEGEGIPAEEREEVFERFVRRNVGEIAGAASGMGLGLHIVRTLVEQMGGRIRIEEADTGGARFLVDLPVSGRFAG